MDDAIRRMKRGDISGLEGLVQQYQLKAIRTAYLITQDQAAAEDVVQVVFLNIFRRINQYDPHRPFEPWLMRSVVNEAIKAAHQQAKSLLLDHTDDSWQAWLADGAPLPEEVVTAQGDEEMVRTALMKLPPKQRAVIVMRYYLGMSEQEISQEVNAPAGTVKWRLNAARQQLRGLLLSLTE